jgi:parvulin-like peptidyl-prolyl isomerase
MGVAAGGLLAASAALGQAPGTPARHPDDLAGLRATERTIGQAPTDPHDRRAALVNGVPIFWEDLQPSMTELAGGQALQEAVLDRLLSEQLKTRGLTVTTEDIASEQATLAASVVRNAKTTPQEAERLLEQVRKSRGLGATRFDGLLRRSAMMRKLVAESVTVSEEEVKQAFEISHGPKYRARLILVPTQREASDLRNSLLGITPGEPAPTPPARDVLTLRFSESATKLSSDPSANRGGLMDPISPADPAYPAAARQMLARLTPGELSAVIPVDRGFALLLLEEQLPPDGVKLEDVSTQIRAEVRKRRERLAMDDLARRLLRGANVSILDRSLDWSWRNSLPAAQP